MERGNTDAGSSGAHHRPNEFNWRSLPCVKLPPLTARSTDCPRKPELTTLNDFFEVHANGWDLKSVDKLPAASRPDPAFRRFHPLASGLLMLDDLGKARGFGDSEAAALLYDRDGRLTAQAGFDHKFYRLGLHPHGREFIAMSGAGTLHAYDDDLRLLWSTGLADTPQVQALCRRFAICDESLKNHVRCVALSRDRSRYLLTVVDEVWCMDLRGEVIWGLRLPRRDDCRFRITADVSTDISPALKVLELSLPTTPREIQARYRELAMRWHPDRNGSAQAHLQMAALNSAVELLREVDPEILQGEYGSAFAGAQIVEFDHAGAAFPITFGFGLGLDADWIYAADFAADSNAVYVGSYSGRVVAIDSDGQAQHVYDVGAPPRRIVDTGEFLYILTHAALYVLHQGSLQTIIDLLDSGQVVIAPNGFGVLETRRLRWFGPDGRLLGTFVSSDPIRRIYQPGTGIALETRTRRAIVAGPPSWWA
jgi:hypothetical protein